MEIQENQTNINKYLREGPIANQEEELRWRVGFMSSWVKGNLTTTNKTN